MCRLHSLLSWRFVPLAALQHRIPGSGSQDPLMRRGANCRLDGAFLEQMTVLPERGARRHGGHDDAGVGLAAVEGLPDCDFLDGLPLATTVELPLRAQNEYAQQLQDGSSQACVAIWIAGSAAAKSCAATYVA